MRPKEWMLGFFWSEKRRERKEIEAHRSPTVENQNVTRKLVS